MKRLKLDIGQFELIVQVAPSEGLKLKMWLDSEGYKFRDSLYMEIIHFNVLCDNYTDAAKIETFLSTPND